MFGAIQYASGNDLRGTISDAKADIAGQALASSALTPRGSNASDSVNRAGKSDRAAVAMVRAEQGQTLSFRVQGLSDTSVLLRLASTPVSIAKKDGSSTGIVSMNRTQQKNAVACEPPVSTLTEVARLMQPGRCVT
jgi:hypothetical protein